MKKLSMVVAIVVLLCPTVTVWADVFNLGPGLTSLTTRFVGDPGNAADYRYSDAGVGSVAGVYCMGTYEVTCAQYVEFLNAKAKSDPYELYRVAMSADAEGCGIVRSGSPGSYSYSVASDRANRPVTLVSFWDAVRFANWLHNGQGNGDTETGAYTLNSYNGADGWGIQRNPGALWFVPSQDEWYKSAYYKGGGVNAGYWDYPTQDDMIPSNDVLTPDPGSSANFYRNHYTIGSPYWRTEAGEFENSGSAYHTFDQGGNADEWTEQTILGTGWSKRCVRGGAYNTGAAGLLAMYATGVDPSGHAHSFGFRVATVPEPGSLAVLATGGLGLLIGLKRRRA